MGRPPKLNPNKKLDPLQRERLVGGLLGDCWIERATPTGNARVGLQITVENQTYFDSWKSMMSGWLEDKKVEVVMKSFKGGPEFPQNTARTLTHPDFTELYEVFRPVYKGDKVVPIVSWLLSNFTAASLAEMHSQDGSRHGLNAGSGFDIHTQGFGFEGTARLAILLNEKFGLYAWATPDSKIDKKTKQRREYWTVYVSSDSYNTFISLVSPYMNASLLATKAHPAGSKSTGVNPKNKAAVFLSLFVSNTQLREDVHYKVPGADLQKYREIISGNSSNLTNTNP